MILRFAFIYFLGVFTLGFILGIQRELVLKQLLGQSLAILVELPIMLICSWVLSSQLRKKISLNPSAAAKAGAVAFAVLMLFELAIGLFFYGLEEHLRRTFYPPGLYGFLAQVIFGMIPWIQVKSSSKLH